VPLTRRSFLAGAGALAVRGASGRAHPLLFLSEPDAERMRDLCGRRDPAVIRGLLKTALTAGPWSVTFHRPPGLDVAPNDYVSEAPYHWPDPKNPGGPYIRKDGEHNPDRFDANVQDLRAMCSSILSLGMGAWLLGDRACAPHASKILSVWFLDPKTRMNPNLEHGQLIRGVNTGRGAGQIDSRPLMDAAQGLVLMELAGGIDSGVAAGVRLWYADYLKWMLESSHGQSERKAGNNHATWWTVQLAAHAGFTGNESATRTAWQRFRDYLVPVEIRPDGSCPREEERTRSLHYSSMNLDAFALLCRLAQLDDVDLWHFRTPKGVGVETACNYLLPYYQHPEKWKRKQIDKYVPGEHYFAGLAGIGLPSPRYLTAYDRVQRIGSAWVQFIDLLIRSVRS